MNDGLNRILFFVLGLAVSTLLITLPLSGVNIKRGEAIHHICKNKCKSSNCTWEIRDKTIVCKCITER